MASTYVNNLRVAEPADGDSGWGTSTNTSLELIGEALGIGTEAITTNADTHTSTVADGTSDEARAFRIKYTGTLDSDCTITIGPNTMKRVQIIENATSGGFSIIISQGSGANVTIASSSSKVVYLDGAGSGAAVFDALPDAIGTDQIADNAVTGGKLNPPLVQGDIIYADGTDTITRLAKGTAAQVLTMNGGATAPSWADAAGGGLDLDTTVKTSGFTAAAGNQYLCNTSGGAFAVQLPAGSAGDTIGIIDYNGTFHTNNLTLTQSGSEKIFRVDADGTIDTKNWSTSIKYMDATVGWLPTGD